MKLVHVTPVKTVVEGTFDEIDDLRKLLSYKDREVERKIKKLKKMKYKWGEDYVAGRLADLEPQLNKTMLNEDETGHWFLSGLTHRVLEKYPMTEVERRFSYPEFGLRPWNKMPPYDPFPYQVEGSRNLLANPHSHVEMATGIGKSFIAHMLCKATALPTIVSTPSQTIARQFYAEAVEYFGKNRVGLYGAGKKEVGKDILVCVGKSLSLITDPEEMKKFLKYQVLISDESHTLPANEFQYFCNVLLAHCPFRWFLSATQERNDGRDLLLEGIIGKRVYTYTIQRAIEEGYLAKLYFLVFDVMSDSTYHSDMIVKMNQEHVYKNYKIARMIADISYEAVMNGMPTLILVDEHMQEEILRAYMRVPYEYASGKSDGNRICRDFNDGKIMCVIGTSAISTGTNFKPVRLTVNWQANKAGTKVKQGPIGRSTRIDKKSGKTDCKIIDFRIKNVPMLKRHADIRINYYKEVGPVQVLPLGEIS